MSDEPVEFQLFGGVAAVRGGQRVDVGPARQQCVLAVLLVDANNPVAVDTLIDRVWAGDPPVRAKDSLHTYLARLRRALPDVPITRNGAGYQLSADEEAVDLHRFRALAAAARRNTDPALFEQALAVWRAEPLAGINVPWAQGLRTALAQERMVVELDHTDAQLDRGRHNEILPMLDARIQENPLDERLAGQYLLALYRAGRQADALGHYERVRTRLADELGIDPSPDLRDLHQRILTGELPLAEAAPPAVPVPRQLPAAPNSFTGRARELQALTSALDRGAEPGSTVVISAVGGTGGIGKTWLALHWAHQYLDRFPDGQLFVNLRGFDPSGTPTSPQDAIRGFLDTFAVDPSSTPASFDAQTALYRSLVAGKRMLVVLDNAANAAQVAPLLPGSPTCTVLVTSRDRMISLVNTHGARPLPLDALSEAEARALLVNRLGADRLDREPEAVAVLIAICAGLPLALSIVASRALEHPDFPLRELANELREATDRLDALDDIDVSVRSVLSWSYAALTEEQARVFGLLGLAPGPDISLAAAANLANLAENRTRSILRALERVSLVQQQVPGRYRMHDLVRLYAAGQVSAIDDAENTAALRRLADFYLHSAFAAQHLLDKHRPVPITLEPAVTGCEPLGFADASAARSWLDTERACLVACGPLSIGNGWYPMAYHLAWTLDQFLLWRGSTDDHILLWQCALTAVKHLRDQATEARVERRLGNVYGRMHRFDEAIAHAERALRIAEEIGDLDALAQSNNNLGALWEQQGDFRTAREYATSALEYFRKLGNPVLAARVLSSIGWLSAQLSEFERAEAHCLAALDDLRKHQDSEADLLDSLGYIAHRTNQLDRAIDYYEQALRTYHDMGNSHGEANTLHRIGDVYVTRGQPDQARSAWLKALGLFQADNMASDVNTMRARIAQLDQRANA